MASETPLSNTSSDQEIGGRLQVELEELRTRIEDNREPDGPIRQALLPSLKASMDVVAALIEDGQPEVAAEVLNPVSKEVDRILQRGY